MLRMLESRVMKKWLRAVFLEGWNEACLGAFLMIMVFTYFFMLILATRVTIILSLIGFMLFGMWAWISDEIKKESLAEERADEMLSGSSYRSESGSYEA